MQLADPGDGTAEDVTLSGVVTTILSLCLVVRQEVDDVIMPPNNLAESLASPTATGGNL
jgi:hypothetical protein